jgi:hypothetical protein
MDRRLDSMDRHIDEREKLVGRHYDGFNKRVA